MGIPTPVLGWVGTDVAALRGVVHTHSGASGAGPTCRAFQHPKYVNSG